MTKDQITKLKIYQRFIESILDNVNYDVKKIKDSYRSEHNSSDVIGRTIKECESIMLVMKEELKLCVSRAQEKVDKLIEEL